MAETETIEIVISEIDLYVINKVREMRVPKELSQVKLSILMGLAEGAKYNIRHLNLLAKALKCSPQDFLPEKPLRGDMIKVRMKIQRDKSRKGDPNYEILKIESIND